MLRSTAWIACALLLVSACGDDGDSGSTTTAEAETGTGTGDTTGSTTSTGTTTTSTGTTTTSTGTTTASTTGDPSTSSTTGDPSTSGDSTGQDLMCDPVVPGNWAACRDGDSFNLAACNFESGVGNGTLNCLTTDSNPNASVCLIEGCVDACDCFAPPATGNATVICAPNGDTNACALGCAQGQTCPDGMQCITGVCFNVP